MAPTAARGLRAAMNGGVPSQDISSLRAFTSTGEAWDEPTWWWLFREVGEEKLPIINYTGGTETGGGILSNYTCAPISCATSRTVAPTLMGRGLPSGSLTVMPLLMSWVGHGILFLSMRSLASDRRASGRHGRNRTADPHRVKVVL